MRLGRERERERAQHTGNIRDGLATAAVVVVVVLSAVTRGRLFTRDLNIPATLKVEKLCKEKKGRVGS